MLKKITLVLFCQLLFLPLTLSAQYKVWDRIHQPESTGAITQPVDQVVDSENNIYVAGFEQRDEYSHLTLFKMNWQGTIEWSRTYISPDSVECKPVNLQMDVENNLILTGYNFNLHSGLDVVILKYNLDGSLVWENTWSSDGYLADYPKCLAIDGQSNIYIGVETITALGKEDISMLKYTSLGNLELESTYGDEINRIDHVNKIYVRDGKINLLGTTQESDYADFLFLCINQDGAIEKEMTFSYLIHSDDAFADYILDRNMDIVLFVFKIGNMSSNERYLSNVIKINNQGDVLWATTVYAGPWRNSEPYKLIQTEDNHILTIGSAVEGGQRVFTDFLEFNELSPDGTLLLHKNYPRYEFQTRHISLDIQRDILKDFPSNHRLSIDSNGFLYAVIVKFIPNGNLRIPHLAKFSPERDLLWEKDITPSTIDNPYTFRGSIPQVTPNNNIYLLGSMYDFSASTGITLIQRYTEHFNSSYRAELTTSIDTLINNNELTLEWNDVGNEYSYRVMVSEDSLDYSNLLYDSISANNSISVAFEMESRNYYYKVLPFNLIEIAEESAIGKFNYIPELPEIEVEFTLSQNFPNPFKDLTRIVYGIPQEIGDNQAVLKIYNILGEEILKRELDTSPGYHEFIFNQPLSSGIYIYDLSLGEKRITKKMLLIK